MIQFVIIKPLIVVSEIILHLFGLYHEGVWSPKQAYLYFMLVFNVSYTWALMALMNFYLGTHDILAVSKK